MKIKTHNHGNVVLELGKHDEQMLAAASTAPFQIKRILVPVDFSECSTKALQYAVALAQQHGASIVLLYVVEGFVVPAESGVLEYAAVQAQMREAGQSRLNRFYDDIKVKVAAETTIRTGSPWREIVEEARSLPADLIVISTHGHTNLHRVLLGSVAEHVVRHAPCPVLVVREKEHEFLKS